MECTQETLMRFIVSQLKNATRRALVGFALNSGFTFLQLLLRWSRHKRCAPRTFIRTIVCNRDSFRLAAFMGCFGFVFQCIKRLLRGTTSSRLVQATVAGAAAGVSIHTLSGASGTHLDPTELALHTVVRAVDAAARQTSISKFVNHLDAATFIASCTVIMYCWFFHPQSLSREYRNWISKMAQMDPFLLDLLRQLKDGRIKYGVHTHALDDYCDRHGIARERGDPGNGFVCCSVVHPQDGMNCAANSLRRAGRGFHSAISLYLPVHLVAQILVHRRVLFQPMSMRSSDNNDSASPMQAFLHRVQHVLRCCWRATIAAARSSAFLGTFIGLAWAGVCIARRLRKDDLPSGPLLGSFLSGWAIFLEASHRRAELAAYVAPRALHTAWHRLECKGWVINVPGAHVSIFAIACAVLLGAYEYSKTRRPAEGPADADAGAGAERDSASDSNPPPRSTSLTNVVNKQARSFSPTLAAIIDLFTT